MISGSAATLIFLLTAGVIASASAQTSTPARAAPGRIIEEVTVASTPLGGLELPIDRIPGNLQRATSEEIERAHQVGLAQFLERGLGSVFINEAQNNPLQPDVQFRGFVASPLLGQPQGLAVYQDGVRVNDPFGDIVNWALIPELSIASIDVIPGSNPVFGLNALGGALSLHTKNGFTHPGTQAEVTGGSFGRVVAGVQSGGHREDRWSYYASARYLDEDGWRDHSPSEALHLFTNLGWRNETTATELTVSRIETDLIGNGPAPIQLLASDHEAIYTHPDRTENSLTFVTLSLDHSLAPDVLLSGVGYARLSNVASLNGDESESDFGAANNRARTNQDTVGASVQVGVKSTLARRENRLIVGGSFDHSAVAFGSSSELGRFDDERGVIGSGVFDDTAFVDLDTNVENLSAFFTDTFAVTSELDLTLSGRYNDTRIELRDQIGTDLNGDHRFKRFSGALGGTYSVSPALRLYASWGESSRAPSPVELTCADEEAPCALPNAFLSDPPLEQVVARTFEAGARGVWRDMRWHAGLFRADNRDDILFISAGALTNRGYFDNVGETRRQGIELNFEGSLFEGRVAWFARYTHLQAQFRDSFVVSSPNNPSAIDAEIPVSSGDNIPGVPERLLGAGVTLALTDGFTVDVDARYQSSQFLRGDEGNLNAPLSGYTVVNAGVEWQLSSTLSAFAQVDNLFDTDYATFGLYGAAEEVLGDGFDDPRFISPAAPRSAWIGLRWIVQ